MSGMGDLSAHFSRWEFRCPHCTGLKNPTVELLAALERLREEVGLPLQIVSGYRCTVYNAQVGGIRTSQHLWSNAVDIPGNYASVDQCRRAGFHGVGIRRARVVHVDMTPGRGFFTFKD